MFYNVFDKAFRVIAGGKFWLNTIKWFLVYLGMKKLHI